MDTLSSVHTQYGGKIMIVNLAAILSGYGCKEKEC